MLLEPGPVVGFPAIPIQADAGEHIPLNPTVVATRITADHIAAVVGTTKYGSPRPKNLPHLLQPLVSASSLSRLMSALVGSRPNRRRCSRFMNLSYRRGRHSPCHAAQSRAQRPPCPVAAPLLGRVAGAAPAHLASGLYQVRAISRPGLYQFLAHNLRGYTMAPVNRRRET
jgi:hypothetical protein